MVGKGENIHHLIYIDDLIDALFLAAESEKGLGEIFVISGKEPVTTNEMVNTIASELGSTGPKFRAPFLPFLVLAIVMEKTLRPKQLKCCS